MPQMGHDTINTIIAALSLIVAIISPFIVYQLLDPKIQELKHAPRLHVTEIAERRGEEHSLAASIRNLGRTPASGIHVVFHTSNEGVKLPSEPRVQVFPPSPFGIRSSQGEIVVSLERNLAQDQKVSVVLMGLKAVDDHTDWFISTCVYYDQGEAPVAYIQSVTRGKNGMASSIRTALPRAEDSYEPGSVLSKDKE